MDISKKSHSLIWLLTLGVFSIINTEMGVVGMVPQIASHFQVSISEASMTVSLFALAVALSALILPLLCSRLPRKLMLQLTLAVFALSSLIAALTSEFYVLLCCRIIPALLHPVFVSMAFTIAAASVEKEQAPQAIAKVFIGVSAGMVLGVPVMSFITVHGSYKLAMLCFAFVSGLIFVLVTLFVPKMPAVRQNLGSQLSILVNPSLWFAVLAYTCLNGAVFGFFSFMTEFLNRVSELSFDAAALMLFGYGIANIFGNVLAGKLYIRRPIFYSAAVPAILLISYLMLYVSASLPAAACTLLLLVGLVAGFMVVPGQHLISSAAGHAQDFANGLFLTAANFGTMIGTALCGEFIDAAGTKSVLFGSFVMLILAVAFLWLRINKGHSQVVETHINC